MVIKQLIDAANSANQKFVKFHDQGFDFRTIGPSEFYGFFPYRNGFLLNDASPVGGILVLGQDFGTVKYLDDHIRDKSELEYATCRSLRKMLDSTELEKRVFVSNVFLGLRQEGGNTGMNTLYKKREADYLTGSVKFVKDQISILRPKLIIALGQHPFTFLKRNVLGDGEFKWQGFRNYREQLKNDHCQIEVDKFPTSLICIPHPSFFFPNQKNTGFDAEFFRMKVAELTGIKRSEAVAQ